LCSAIFTQLNYPAKRQQMRGKQGGVCKGKKCGSATSRSIPRVIR
jgi:hypothetical protein